MTLQRIWHFVRRWAWLCALAVVLAAGTSYLISSRLPRVYEGTAKLLVTPSQTGSGQASYNDVLTAERLAELRELADVVILDSPPVLAFSDPAVLAGPVDGTLLVANSEKTRGQHAAQTVTTLQKAGAHVLGVILNRTRRSGRGYYAYEPRSYEAQPSSAPTG